MGLDLWTPENIDGDGSGLDRQTREETCKRIAFEGRNA